MFPEFLYIIPVCLNAHFILLFASLTDDCGTSIKADIVFAVDASSSVKEHNFRVQLRFVSHIIKRLDVDSGNARIGLLSFQTIPRIHFYVNDYFTRDQILRAIKTVPYKFGSTNTADAIRTARKVMLTQSRGARVSENIPQILILITDGVSNMYANETVPEAMAAHEAGIHIYTIGVGLVGFTHEIDQIASPPSNVNRYVVKHFGELKSIEEKFVRQMCLGRNLTWNIARYKV